MRGLRPLFQAEIVTSTSVPPKRGDALARTPIGFLVTGQVTDRRPTDRLDETPGWALLPVLHLAGLVLQAVAHLQNLDRLEARTPAEIRPDDRDPARDDPFLGVHGSEAAHVLPQ